MLTLVSDLPGSARRHFIGIDNQAAGRSAASLLGRFCAAGRIGIIAGSLGLRDHRERFEGFAGVLGREFPKLEIVGPLEGLRRRRGDRGGSAETARPTATSRGIYNLGAGNAGLVAALGKTHRAGNVRVIAHELTDTDPRGPARRHARCGPRPESGRRNPRRHCRRAAGGALATGGDSLRTH